VVEEGEGDAHVDERVLRVLAAHPAQRRRPDARVSLDDLELLLGELSRFQQDRVGDAHLADVVQGRGVVDVLDEGVVDEEGVARVLAELSGEHGAEFPRPFDVPPGLVVPVLCQLRHRMDRRHLRVGDLLHLLPDKLFEFRHVFFKLAAHLPQRNVRLHSRQDLLRLKRFGHVVHASGGKGPHLALRVVQRADEDHGNFPEAFILFQPAAYFKTVHLRHHDVEQNQIGFFPFERAERRFSAGEDQHLVPFFVQHRPKKFEVGRGIVDQHDGRLFVVIVHGDSTSSGKRSVSVS